MHKFIRAVYVCSFVLCTTLVSFSQTYTTGVVRVKFKENSIPQAQAGRLKKNQIGIASVDQAGTTLGITSIQRVFRESTRFEKAHREFGLHLWYEIKFNPQTSVQAALDTYRKLGELEIVEPCLPYQLVEPIKASTNNESPSAFSDPTNDPLFVQQWHYQNTGQGNGTPGADISLPQAWTIQTGSPEVIVAVIDGGIDILHPDLQASLWVNADEIPNNSIDDDHNGYVDDVNGYGFGDNTGRIYPNFHGTHVGGTIAAVTNNSVGVAGIAGGNGTGNGVRLMSCAGFGVFGTGGFEDAMVYAADNGAVISQNSWRGGSNAIEAAIDYFVARAGYDNSEDHFDDNIQIGPMAGGIVIFAAGNSNTSDPNDGYPASYSPNMAVAATDHNDVKSVFSNYGSWVDIAAPGTDVFSTYPVELGSYTTLSGTSMACPHVSGVAALIISQFKRPGYSPFLVWDRIQLTADNIDALNPGFEDKLGGGRLNAYQALQVADDVPPSPITTLSASARLASVVLQWTSTGASGNTGAASSYDLRYSLAPITAANFNTATAVAGIPKPKVAGSAEEFEVVGLTPSTTYYFAIKSSDFFGNVSTISNVVSIATLEPPVIHVTPLSIESALLSGQSESRTITIQNTGTSALSWDLNFAADAVPGSLQQGIDKSADQKLKTDDKNSTGFNNTGEQISTALADGYSMKAIGDFEIKTASPVTLTCVTVDPNTGLIYAQANQGNVFYRYSPVTNQWTQLLDCPVYSGNNGGAVFLNGKIYTSYQDYSTIGVYNIAANTWSTMSSGLPWGGTGSMTTDGSYLYMVRGYDFRKYAPLTNTWSTLASSPIGFTGWGGLSYYNNTIFGHEGNGLSGFAKYNVGSDTWTVLPSVPGGAVLGAAIDEGNGIYYTYGNYYGYTWFAYDIANQTWSVNATSIPFAIHDGGLAYVSQSGVSGVYFTQGEAGNNFARFETGPSSRWLHVDPLSGSVAAGTSQTVNVSLNAENLVGGTYHATIDIQHNDPTHGTIEIPVTLVVTGAPAMKVSRPSFAFGDVYIGAQHDSVLTITNTGTDILSISAMAVGNANYHITFTPFTLNPAEHRDFVIGFRPVSPGTYNTTLTITSNDPSHPTLSIPLTGKGLFNPMSVTPSSIAVTLNTGGQETRQVTIRNSSSSGMTWIGNIGGSRTNNLADILSNLNANYAQVTSAIPGRYDFSEGESGYYINDGGSDMYDVGNIITTDVAGSSGYISYTNGSIMSDSKFGPSGRYFTTKFQGLFVMVADVEINSFSISGNLGADGSGLVDGAVLSTIRGGKSYRGFIKRVYNAYDPSVNHLIIMENGGESTEDYTSSTDNDFHKINNVSGVKRIYYLLFAGSSGGYIDNASMQTIMETFLSSVNEGVPWISMEKKTGTVPASGSENVPVTFSAVNMESGVYRDSISFTNDASLSHPVVSVPVTLTVVGAPDIDLSKTQVDFQNVYVGDLVTRFVSLKNLGTERLIVSSIVSTNALFTVTPSNATLNPRDSVRIYVTFRPTEVGSKTGTIQITSNDSDETMRTISLTGNGVTPPVASIAPGTVDLKILRGDRQNVLIKIRNTGGDVMNWSISNFWSVPNWSALSDQAGRLFAGQEQNLNLTIDAKTLSLTTYTFDIYFNYNSPVNPQIVIPVKVQVVENNSPIVIHSIADRTMQLRDPALSINLAEYFSDADGEPLLYYAQAGNTVVGATTLGSDLLLAPLQLGKSQISVWAVDGLGDRADIAFVVNVVASKNHSPVVVHSIADQTIQQQDPAMSINLAEYFSDADGEPLAYFVDANNTAIVGASIVGSSLLLEPRALGISKVKVWTVDGLGEHADLQFNLTVAAVTGTEYDATVSSLQNHPNPFSDKTMISYHLKKNGHVQLVVQDITGRVMQTMVDENQVPGEKNVEYKGMAIQSGLYFYHLIVDGKSCGVRKMIKY